MSNLVSQMPLKSYLAAMFDFLNIDQSIDISINSCLNVLPHLAHWYDSI